MVTTVLLLYALTLPPAAATPAPRFSDAAIDRVVHQERFFEAAPESEAPPADAAARALFEEGRLSQELTVRDFVNQVVIDPIEYRRVDPTGQGLIFPNGGISGSVSFDVLTQTYWWE